MERSVIVPSLVDLPLAVSDQVVLAVEPFCAFNAVMLTQTGKVLIHFRILVLSKVLRGIDVGADLVEVSAKKDRHVRY